MGQVADLRVLLGGDAVHDEVVQQSVRADHTQRAVPGADQLAGRLHDALQGGAQIQVGADADHRVEQGAQPLPAGDHLADPDQHFLQQFVEAHPRERAQPERRGRRRFPTGLRRAVGHREMVAPVTFLAGPVNRARPGPRRCRPPGRWPAAACAVGRRAPGPRCPTAARCREADPGEQLTQGLPGARHLDHRAERHHGHAEPSGGQPPGGERFTGAQPAVPLVLVAVQDRVHRHAVVAGAHRQTAGTAEVAARHGGLRRLLGQHLRRQAGALAGTAGPVGQLGAQLRVLGLDRVGVPGGGGQLQHLVAVEDLQPATLRAHRPGDLLDCRGRHRLVADRPPVGVPDLHALHHVHGVRVCRDLAQVGQPGQQLAVARVGQPLHHGTPPLCRQREPRVVQGGAAADREQSALRVGGGELPVGD